MRELKNSTDGAHASKTRRGGGPHISLERRLHPRHPAVDYRVWVGGWASEHEFVTMAAMIENISLGGARITTAVPFSSDEDVWLRPGRPDSTGCVRAEVLETVPTAGGQYASRLRFYEPCPSDVIRCIAGDRADTP